MSYVFDLEADLDEVEIDASGSQLIEFAVGYDLDDLVAVLMLVALVPTDKNICDLRFGLRQRSLMEKGLASSVDFAHDTVGEFVPKNNRTEVLATVLIAVEKLVSLTKCDHITMSTYHQNLPPEAMDKYDEIANILENMGFPCENQFRDADGTDYWLFRKSDGRA